MKTNIRFWSYIAQFFLEWEMIVEILRVEVVLLIGGHWPPIKLIDLIKMQIS